MGRELGALRGQIRTGCSLRGPQGNVHGKHPSCTRQEPRSDDPQHGACGVCTSHGEMRLTRTWCALSGARLTNVHPSLGLSPLQGVWSLRGAWGDVYDKYLVLTFVGETRLLAINAEDELDEAEVSDSDG